MTNERIYKADGEGRFIGVGLREELHSKATSERHAAVIALVVDADGRILVQWRAKGKLGGDRLDVSATTHVREGEDYEDALRRCLRHELGVSNPLHIHHLFDFEYEEELGDFIEKEHCRVYRVESDDEISPNTEEADYVEYLPLRTIKERIRAEPVKATKWLKETVNRIKTV